MKLPLIDKVKKMLTMHYPVVYESGLEVCFSAIPIKDGKKVLFIRKDNKTEVRRVNCCKYNSEYTCEVEKYKIYLVTKQTENILDIRWWRAIYYLGGVLVGIFICLT